MCVVGYVLVVHSQCLHPTCSCFYLYLSHACHIIPSYHEKRLSVVVCELGFVMVTHRVASTVSPFSDAVVGTMYRVNDTWYKNRETYRMYAPLLSM